LKPKTDHYLDIRGAIPPISLLKISQVFRDMKPNEILEIHGRDPDTRTDLLKVLPELSYKLIVFEEMARDASYRVKIKKEGER
jgi:TusA-related sulfurtransferase